MTDALKSLPSAPYHFILYAAVVGRLYYTLPLSSFVVAAFALLWLVVRLDRVLKQPVDDLIRILGIEAPSAPVVSLLDITCDSISLHWKALERKAETKYAILVNGVAVGEVALQDPSVTIKGLAAGICYTIRVIAINNQNFQAASDPIRAQTSRPTADDENDCAAAAPDAATAPSIVAYKGPHEGLVTPLATAVLPKEHRLSNSQKQPISHRKSSPILPSDLPESGSAKQATSGNSRQMQKQLQERLNEVKQEVDELRQQDEEEERQFVVERDGLTERRDAMRQALKDKEDDSKELRKEVNQLERRNVALQQRKTNQERALESKRHERRKLREDIEKWKREVGQFRETMRSMAEQKEKTELETQEGVEQAREEREPGLQAMKQLEEQIQQTGRHVRDLEEARQVTGVSPSSSSPTEADISRMEEDRLFNEKITALRTTMHRLWLECDSSRKHIAQLHARANSLTMQRRGSQAALYDQGMGSDLYASNSELSNVSQRLPGSRNMGSQLGNPFSSSMDFDARAAFASPIPSRVPLLHTETSRSDPSVYEPATQADIDRLTGGAMASPSASALIPSDLLGDDIEDLARRHQTRLSAQMPDVLGSRPSSIVQPIATGDMPRWLTDEANLLPGLGNVPNTGSTSALNYQGPQSPTKEDSHSPSLASSPHDSVSAFHPARFSDGHIDSDRRSIRSTSSSSRMAAGRSRFLGDIFSRQRGKTDADEGPALGSLKDQQTRSMPRSAAGEGPGVAENSPEQKRISSGSFLGSMSHGFLGRRNHAASHLIDENEDIAQRPLPARTSAFSRFGSRVNPWANSDLDPSSTSRPDSVYSAESAFPYPSSESQPFGWYGGGIGRSNTSSSNPNVNRMRSPWSPYGSRRGSLQVENASISELGETNRDTLPLGGQGEAPTQAPIGTKPLRFGMKKTPSARGASPANGKDKDKHAHQNTRDLKNMFGSKKSTRSSSKSGSTKKKKKNKEPSVSSVDDKDRLHPADRRISADFASSLSATTASTDDLPGSGSIRPNDSSAPGTPSVDGTPTNRESLMRKLTRKSSYIPGLMSRRSTAPNTPQLGGADSDDEAAAQSASAGLLARTPSSIASSPKASHEAERGGKRQSGFSLSSFKRKGRRAQDAPSVSEASMTSETGDDSVEGRSGRASVDEQ